MIESDALVISQIINEQQIVFENWKLAKHLLNLELNRS